MFHDMIVKALGYAPPGVLQQRIEPLTVSNGRDLRARHQDLKRVGEEQHQHQKEHLDGHHDRHDVGDHVGVDLARRVDRYE